MANYKQIFETCSITLFILVTIQLIKDTLIISFIAWHTGKSIWAASQIYKESWDKILEGDFSCLTIEESEKVGEEGDEKEDMDWCEIEEEEEEEEKEQEQGQDKEIISATFDAGIPTALKVPKVMEVPVPEVVEAADVPEVSEAMDALDYTMSRVETLLSEFRLDIPSESKWHTDMENHLMKLIRHSDELFDRASMWTQRERSAEVENAGEPLKTPANEPAPQTLPPVSSAISSTTAETTEVSGRTWRLFYSDTVCKRDNSLRVEWETKERYEA
ncbi:hypothetical protein OCU04_007353 [Sclerotinia nivalis]|uniref:Uncharacterized protein n=1 Tax=Sclerotinia nivalis TaxID=352851 RepID=A0A9X0AIK3_9HELO|nr:hypothetical protein OCU04_007353 [Sclerotinia nivalis]